MLKMYEMFGVLWAYCTREQEPHVSDAEKKLKKEFFIVLLWGKLKMGIGLALLGMALGAAGTEFLRAKRPELIKKIEDAARRFVDLVCPSEADDAKTPEK